MQQPLPSLPVFCLKIFPATTTLTEIFRPSANSSPTPAQLCRPVDSQPGTVEEGLDLYLPYHKHIWRLASINTVCAWRLPSKTQKQKLRFKIKIQKKVGPMHGAGMRNIRVRVHWRGYSCRGQLAGFDFRLYERLHEVSTPEDVEMPSSTKRAATVGTPDTTQTSRTKMPGFSITSRSFCFGSSSC